MTAAARSSASGKSGSDSGRRRSPHARQQMDEEAGRFEHDESEHPRNKEGTPRAIRSFIGDLQVEIQARLATLAGENTPLSVTWVTTQY